MKKIIFSQNTTHPSVYLKKKIFTVGYGSGFDVNLISNESKLLFTFIEDSNELKIVPAKGSKLLLNGNPILTPTTCAHGDRVTYESFWCIILEKELDVQETSNYQAKDLLFEALSEIANVLDQSQQIENAFERILNAIMNISGAEEGCLLFNHQEDSSWSVVQSLRDSERTNLNSYRKELFSDTILQDVLKTREPVLIENIIGHKYSQAQSVIESRAFSIACIPLVVGTHFMGAAYLYTRNPGKSIQKESLKNLKIFCSQLALLLSLYSELSQARDENKRLLKVHEKGMTSLIYNRDSENHPLTELEHKIAKVANSALPIIIQGETGTGKELVAREIHRMSDRNQHPFIAINCAAIPATLIEGILFGFEKGAFTGAVKAQIGKFQLADKGTLFLDEIGDLDLDLQSKLLRAIQEKTIEPIGAHRSITVDVRILCATHKHLDKMVQENRFRQDLYYRLNGLTLTLPALRKRKVDLPILSTYFLEKHSKEQHIPFKPLSEQCLDMLMNHPWPGNVRELEQVLLRALVLCDSSQILPQHVQIDQLQIPAEEESSIFWEQFDSLDEAQIAFTRNFVEKTLQKTKGNRSQAAKVLGISERTLYRILSES